MIRDIRVVPSKEFPQDLVDKDLINAPDGFFEKIEVVDALEVSSYSNILDIVSSKIKKGGVLILSGIDSVVLCREIVNGNCNLEEASKFFAPIKNLFTIPKLKEYFINKKWKIKTCGISSTRYLFITERL